MLMSDVGSRSAALHHDLSEQQLSSISLERDGNPYTLNHYFHDFHDFLQISRSERKADMLKPKSRLETISGYDNKARTGTKLIANLDDIKSTTKKTKATWIRSKKKYTISYVHTTKLHENALSIMFTCKPLATVS